MWKTDSFKREAQTPGDLVTPWSSQPQTSFSSLPPSQLAPSANGPRSSTLFLGPKPQKSVLLPLLSPPPPIPWNSQQTQEHPHRSGPMAGLPPSPRRPTGLLYTLKLEGLYLILHQLPLLWRLPQTHSNGALVLRFSTPAAHLKNYGAGVSPLKLVQSGAQAVELCQVLQEGLVCECVTGTVAKGPVLRRGLRA